MISQFQLNSSEWKVLDQHLKLGSLSFVDVLFARRVLDLISSKEESHAAFLSVLFALSRKGHLVLNFTKKEKESFGDLLSISKQDPLLDLVLEGIADFPFSLASSFVIQSGSFCYLQNNWTYETEILKNLERLMRSSPFLPLPSSGLDSKVNLEQKMAITQALEKSLSFLTGGPGTGKTFTAAQLVKCCLAATDTPEQFRIILTAPTGKAAFQLGSNVRKILDFPAQIKTGTLHALLGVRSSFESKITPLFADLILVDESSMIDARLFSRLLDSIQAGSRVVFIGDKDQLPPVESGSVFADLLESNRYPSTRLQSCLRSDSNSILSLAFAIKEGDAEKSFSILSQKNEWIDLEKLDHASFLRDLWNRFAERFLHLFSEKPPEDHDNALGRFTLLSCTRKGPLGVDALNLYFFNQILSRVGSASWMMIPIMVTGNDYELELYNGDLGVLCCRTSSNPLLKQFSLEDYVLFPGRKISPLAISSFTLSYSVSVHKSQGSEYEEVLIVAPIGSESFGREVLYTAVTRAKKKVILASTKDLIFRAIESSSRKQSGIKERLKGIST